MGISSLWRPMADRSRGLELSIRPTNEFLYSFTFLAFQPDQMSTKTNGEFLALFVPRQLSPIPFMCWMFYARCVRIVGRRSLNGCQDDHIDASLC